MTQRSGGFVPRRKEQGMKDYRTEEEKKICERCDDLICSRHCVIYRKEQEREEAELHAEKKE